jgi:transmembrane sensor
MTETLHEKVDAIRDAAADWVVRLGLPTTGEADWLAFDAWLDASTAHSQAYDQAIGLWSELQASAPQLHAALEDAPPAARPAPNHRWTIAGGLAAAALAVAVVPWADITAPTTVYQTANGERRVVTLSDGTRIDLNAGSRLTVRLKSRSRQVTMDDAEAVFDVAKDAKRPFLISAGDRTIRVVGTQFNVRRRDGVQSVTVRRGVVEVSPTGDAPGKLYRLTVGQRLDHVEGASASALSATVPDEAMSWRTGRLIYRGEPLSNVVADLNRYVSKPVRIADGRVAQLPFSGVLVTDDGLAAVRTLTLLAPVTSTSTSDGILLRAK